MKQNKAITLVALVVTIIVLLILAGVSINMVFGENGIFSKTQIASEKYKQAQDEEQAMINEVTNYITDEYMTGARKDVTITMTEEELENKINEAVESALVSLNTNNKHNYSTTEHEVGTWIDQLPVYERVLELSGSYSGMDKSIYDFSSWGIHKFVKFEGYNRDGNGVSVPLAYGHPSSGWSTGCYLSNKKMYITTTYSPIVNPIFIIQYTKEEDYNKTLNN